jgi:hypothetical protein
MPMSQEHKDALARGRAESRAIKGYLEALGRRKPGRPAKPETLRKRIDDLNQRISAETDPLKKVDLVQQRLDAEDALAAAGSSVDMEELEAGFAQHAASYSERKGISYSAWREAGVPAATLKKAGIPRTRRG